MQLLVPAGLLRAAQVLHVFREGALKARVVERSQFHGVAALVEQGAHGVFHEPGIGVDLELRGTQHVEPELDVGGATGQDRFVVADRGQILDDAVDEALIALGFFVVAEELGEVRGEEAVLNGVPRGRGAAFVCTRTRRFLRILAIRTSFRIDLRIGIARVGRRLVFDCVLILTLLHSFLVLLSFVVELFGLGFRRRLSFDGGLWVGCDAVRLARSFWIFLHCNYPFSVRSGGLLAVQMITIARPAAVACTAGTMKARVNAKGLSGPDLFSTFVTRFWVCRT